MAVTFYSSEDTGSVQTSYSGSSGSYQTNIIDILDSILVNGYGSKPGLGWTKLMTSVVAGSDRTVYSNLSAYEANCNLIVESNKNGYAQFKLQVVDVVTSPEVFSGYSNFSVSYLANMKWMAVGDERTMIFILYSASLATTQTRFFNSHYPACIYIGDFDRQNNSSHKGFGLLATKMHSGTIDTVNTSSSSTGTFYESAIESNDHYKEKSFRPVTQVPGEEWSENAIYAFLSTMMPHYPVATDPISETTPGQYRDTVLFAQNAQMKLPWFLMIQRAYLYKLRGVFNIFPSLLHNDDNKKSNHLKTATIDGVDYIGTSTGPNRYDDYPMTVYIQTSGDW